jgi:hypothetical protein
MCGAVCRMDKIKIILILIAVILGSLAILATISFIYSAFQYLLLFGFLCLAGFIGIRLLIKKSPPQIDALDSQRESKKVEHTLEEYRRQLK